MSEMGETTLIKVNTKSDSLRTTIPNSVIRLFELKEGAKIKWDFNMKKRVCIIVPVHSNGTEGEGGYHD